MIKNIIASINNDKLDIKVMDNKDNQYISIIDNWKDIEVGNRSLMIPNDYFDFLKPYLKTYRVDYIHTIEEIELYGHVKSIWYTPTHFIIWL